MSDKCATTRTDPNSPFPHALAHLPVGDEGVLEYNVAELIDCKGGGIGIASSAWEIHPDDDDLGITLVPGSHSGHDLFAGVIANPTGAGKSYRVKATVTATGTPPAKHSQYFEFPVVDTSIPKYAPAH